MKNKKLILKIFVAVLAVCLVAGAGVLVQMITEGLQYDIDSVESIGSTLEVVKEDVDSISLKKTDDSNLKVLMFTDTHLNGNKNDTLTLKYLVENITREKPDLVIFGGDNISSAISKKRTEQFVQLMKNLGVHWAAVLGNHDAESIMSYSREEVIDLYASAENCLVRQGKEDIDGNGNFTINILNKDGSLREVFFLMDSGDYMSEEYKEKYGVEEDFYDGVKESQVRWYNEKHDEIKKEYGDFKSITVIHIPPYQLWGAKNAEAADFVYGDKREGVCPAGFDAGLFAALKEKGSCQAVYFGHDHINDFGIVYEGLLLSYIQSSGYSSYNMGSKGAPENEWLQGCTILDIMSDGTYYSSRHFNHAE